MRSPTFLIWLVFSGSVFAGGCPAGADDCFLCGGIDGIPCTIDCSGEYSESAGAYVSCECPQGEPCVCYCPYEGGETVVGVGQGGMMQPEGANLARYSGEVYVMAPGGSWVKVASKIPLGQGYSVRTGYGSTATILLDDDCKIYLDGDTTLDLTELQKLEDKSTFSVVLELIKGAIYSDVTKRDGTKFEVHTRVSVAGVKGTAFSVYYDEMMREAEIKVVGGDVQITDLSSETVNLNAGEMMKVGNGGLGDIERFDSAAEKERWVGSGCGSAFIVGAVALGACLAGRLA
ncbi:MAG: FecR family protein [Candidatus Micrarchaeota archaeon]